MKQFFLGFTDLIQGIYWPDLTPYELGEYAAAGAIGALGGILLTGMILLSCVNFKSRGKEG